MQPNGHLKEYPENKEEEENPLAACPTTWSREHRKETSMEVYRLFTLLSFIAGGVGILLTMIGILSADGPVNDLGNYAEEKSRLAGGIDHPEETPQVQEWYQKALSAFNRTAWGVTLLTLALVAALTLVVVG